MFYLVRGAPGRTISVRPDNRTGLIEAGYRPDRTLSSILSDGGLFSELGNKHYEKRSRLLPQSGEKLFLSYNLEKVYVHQKIEFVTVNQSSLNYGGGKIVFFTALW